MVPRPVAAFLVFPQGRAGSGGTKEVGVLMGPRELILHDRQRPVGKLLTEHCEDSR